MKRQTFVLKKTKDFRRFIRVYVKGKDGKTEARNVTFTTEHKVTEKDRNKNAKKIPAEFRTANEILYDGLLRSSAYGKTFVLVGDPKGEKKRTPLEVTLVDAKMIALQNFFYAAGLKFDSSKPYEVLQEEYRIHINSTTGADINVSAPAEIPHEEVNVAGEIENQVDAAKKAYEDKYGNAIPDAFADDKAFLSALSDPDFDAQAYMEKATTPEPDNGEDTIETLRQKYFDQEGVNVPNAYKNKADWIKAKLKE